MSDLTFNKIAGAVLATGLAIVGLREVSTAVFAPHPLEKPGYAIDVPEEAGGGGAAAAEAPIDWGTVLPVADIAAGEASFAKCRSCHTINQGGANGTGPNLYGVMGQKPGTHAGFAYSPAMIEHGNQVGTWQFEDMSEFLKAPQKHIAGTKMTFVGLKRTDERVNMIAYLNAQGSNLPPPPPNPVAAPAEGAAPEGAPTAVEGGAPAAAPEPAPAA
ncbi:MAG: c-type cytochrome [Phenylobacterium sp.]|uniref:c-type cytochrome n=1 Tax=Phenylobacterium sp. TaxID=1871053 RepID=UPI003918C829